MQSITILILQQEYVRLYKKSQSSYISQNAELSDTLDVIERKSESLKNLITQFYDFSRLTAHDYTVNLIKIDTVKLLRESFADNCHILEETHLNVSLDLPDRPIYVLADKTALERIFFNLFQNAGRYAHTFFHITIKNEQNSIKILFANDTCSLSSEDISHLFDRFYIQESARSQGGTGLGLTIARSLAEEIGGELSVSSKKSNGNNSLLISFTLALPSCQFQNFYTGFPFCKYISAIPPYNVRLRVIALYKSNPSFHYTIVF